MVECTLANDVIVCRITNGSVRFRTQHYESATRLWNGSEAGTLRGAAVVSRTRPCVVDAAKTVLDPRSIARDDQQVGFTAHGYGIEYRWLEISTADHYTSDRQFIFRIPFVDVDQWRR